MKRARRRRQIHVRHRGAPNRVGMKRLAREWPAWQARIAAEQAATNKALAYWLDLVTKAPPLFSGIDRRASSPVPPSEREEHVIHEAFNAAVAACEIAIYGVSFYRASADVRFEDIVTATKETE